MFYFVLHQYYLEFIYVINLFVPYDYDLIDLMMFYIYDIFIYDVLYLLLKLFDYFTILDLSLYEALFYYYYLGL